MHESLLGLHLIVNTCKITLCLVWNRCLGCQVCLRWQNHWKVHVRDSSWSKIPLSAPTNHVSDSIQPATSEWREGPVHRCHERGRVENCSESLRNCVVHSWVHIGGQNCRRREKNRVRNFPLRILVQHRCNVESSAGLHMWRVRWKGWRALLS